MFTLQKLNIVRIVNSEQKRDQLLAAGFSLVEKTRPKRDKKSGEQDGPAGDVENSARD